MRTEPEIVSAQEWRAARLDLLAKEKEFTPARDALAAAAVEVTIDPAKGRTEYNFRDRSGDEGWPGWSGEMPGVSAFLRDGDRILRTYSAYERGVDMLLGTYHWLDLTALGRQEDGGPGMLWLRRHDEYEPGQVSNL